MLSLEKPTAITDWSDRASTAMAPQPSNSFADAAIFPSRQRDGNYRIDSMATPTMLNCLMYKLCYYRFVETDGRGFDKVRQTEIGKKYFKLTHFEEVFTTHHWMVRIYKLKPPRNRIRGKVKKSKSKTNSSSKSGSKRKGTRKNPF